MSRDRRQQQQEFKTATLDKSVAKFQPYLQLIGSNSCDPRFNDLKYEYGDISSFAIEEFSDHRCLSMASTSG
jgi:hypothetical protein